MNDLCQRYVIPLAALILLLLSPGCESEPRNTGPRYGSKPASMAVSAYRFAIHPLHNPAKLIQAYLPLINYLNTRLMGARLVLEASRDYADFENKYHARLPAFLLANPWQTL